MVARKRGFGSERVYECEARLGAVGHGNGNGAVELDYRRVKDDDDPGVKIAFMSEEGSDWPPLILAAYSAWLDRS